MQAWTLLSWNLMVWRRNYHSQTVRSSLDVAICFLKALKQPEAGVSTDGQDPPAAQVGAGSLNDLEPSLIISEVEMMYLHHG